TFEPGNHRVIVPEGSTVMQAIAAAGLTLDLPCGGKGTCGKCRITILGSRLQPAEGEIRALEEKEISQGVRLACKTEIHESMTIQLHTASEPAYHILQATDARACRIEPLIEKCCIETDVPSLSDQRSDLERIKDRLIRKNGSYKNLKMRIPALRELPEKLREANYQITVVTDGSEILGVEKGNTEGRMLGIAFDIGTTTIVGYLMDLYSGAELAVSSCLNPQVKFGADVICRCNYAVQNQNGLCALQASLLNVIDRLIGEAAEKSSASRDDIYSVTIVGNTCMHHLFLGLTPKNIASSPFVPVVSEPVDLDAADLGLHVNPVGRVFVLPNIAGFVGADTVGVILATDLDQSSDLRLAIDIGTNGEIVLGSCERLVACSTAAGPAFEGAQIGCGMRGAAGAIDHLRFGEKLTYSVIGDEKAQGICGSGLLDILAGFVELGMINKRGKLLPPGQFTNPAAKVFEKHMITHEGANAFLVADGSETAHGRPILITQKDITALQLAKGAMAAGIRVLMEETGVSLADIGEVLLAGAFGNYMDPHSACAIGLIPPELESRIRAVGNAAGTGSRMALLSRSEYRRADEIASKVQYIELGSHKQFNMKFALGMRF
ncbi:MAG: ASKHA domain-containing protein, partial [Clostridia bacterium]|nr:ASKHA domain-containing protein [Clostridia bacterium]